MHFTWRLALTLAACLFVWGSAHAQSQPAIEGYTDYATFVSQLQKLDESDLVSLSSLGKTLGGRDVWLLTVAAGDPAKKPAILIVGNVSAPHLIGSELALRMAQRIAEAAKSDEPTRRLLEGRTLYIIPRPSPDASEAFFHKPYGEREANERPTDDDRDGAVNEDPNEDLDGDGWITSMRVESPTGKLAPHPADPRVLVDSDPKKNEHGRWTLLSEGKDNDGDELWNEDGPGGVAINHNFSFRYPFFQAGAGPHQVSEPETRAVADFAFARSNIAAVFTFTPEDNLFEPWKPNPGAESKPIKTTLLSADADAFSFVAEEYRKIHGGKDAPPPAKGEGSFSDWAYFHYGRWSFAARAWWIPKVADEEKAKTDDKRGADDLNALAWFKKNSIAGFVDWKPLDHPDFPNKKVEIGGFRPFLRLNPPAGELDPLAEKHVTFIKRLAELSPRLKVAETKIEPLGAGIFRVTALAINEGFLPTEPAIGCLTPSHGVLQIKIELADGMKLVTGNQRVHLPCLAGNGGKAEQTWLIDATGAKSKDIKVRIWHPAVGSDERTATLP